MALARAGHERAFEAIVERYRGLLPRAARRYLPRRAGRGRRAAGVPGGVDARCSAATRCATCAPWLYRIVHNTALNALRASGYDYAELPRSRWRRAVDEVERREDVREALTGLAALPERQREALLRIAVEGRPQGEVARELGVSEGAVRQLVHRARLTLRAAATAVVPMPLGELGRGAAGAGAPGGRPGRGARRGRRRRRAGGGPAPSRDRGRRGRRAGVGVAGVSGGALEPSAPLARARSPRRRPPIVALREQTGWSPRRLAAETDDHTGAVDGPPRPARAGVSRRPRPEQPAVVRYQWPCPGQLLHMDVKKFGRFQAPGHKLTGDRTRLSPGRLRVRALDRR